MTAQTTDSMDSQCTPRDAFGFFRMGLVTGLVDKQALVRWADCQIVNHSRPRHEIIELSLSGSLPYSQIIRLLTSFEGRADYTVSLPLLFARAGLLLEEEPARTEDIIMGLRLLNEEEYFPKELKSQISDLRSALETHRQAALAFEELVTRLSRFLEGYAAYRVLLHQTACLTATTEEVD